MGVLKIIGYIVLFIVCLSILITIHELGHFTAAKIFKVYTQEFSIGFGPALIHKKRKDGETYFSLRIIPFGGYVSMYGEGVELEDGVQIDQSRSLDGIKKWKRAIILVAGVTMNAILALNLFFINNVAFEQKTLYLRNMYIESSSIAEAAGLKTLDVIALDTEIESETKTWYVKDYSNYHLLDTDAVVNYVNGTSENVYAFIDTTNVKDYKNISLNKFIVLFQTNSSSEVELKVDYKKQVPIDANFKNVVIDLQTVTEFDEKKEHGIAFESHSVTIANDNGALQDFGYKFYLDVQKPLPFFKAIGQSFVDFGRSSTLIVRALGTLFTKETWESMGGIVAIGFVSSQTLENFGFGQFLYLWGALSVNLAIVNLLPFPGLDGWQLLVLAIEAIFRKKIPNKVKTIVSIVGLALLFTFMIVIVVKDIITFIL